MSDTYKPKGWICEFCYRELPEGNLPSDWELVWQSAVCPECQARVKATPGGYTVVKCGAYASKSDPREAKRRAIVAGLLPEPTERVEMLATLKTAQKYLRDDTPPAIATVIDVVIRLAEERTQ